MSDDKPRMPARIWADRSDDNLPQYRDTPFGIWWHDPREGYSEYVRADLYNVERQRAEKAEAEVDRLRNPPEEYCAKCGAPRRNHPYRHPFQPRFALRQDEGDRRDD